MLKLEGHERILILKPSSLGDIVHTLPAVSAIHRQFPEIQIDWLANTEWLPLLHEASFLQESISFPRRDLRGLGGLFRARRWARQEFAEKEYDIALDFQGLLRSALLAKLSGARERVGFSQAREGAANLYHHSVCIQDWSQCHAVDRYRRLVESLGVTTDPVEFPLPDGATVELPAPFSNNPIVLHPFSRGAGKSLSVTEVDELCDALSPHPLILVGRIEEGAGVPAKKDHVLDLLNRTDLSGLIYLLRQSAWTVSVDSGPMHLAAGISDRVLSLHTWTNPKMVGPWKPDSWIYREGQFAQAKDLTAGQFPEERHRKRELASQSRLFATEEIARIAEFVHTKLES